MIAKHPIAFAFALAALLAAADFAPALAQTSAPRDDYGIRDIMVEEPGSRPAKKQKGATEPRQRVQPRNYPRGSSYVPSTTLPRSDPARVAPTGPGVYTPPPVNSFSDRVTGCNHSFPLNAGIGNNPTDRSSYVRQCAN